MILRWLLALLGLLHVANGIFMIAAPEAWYAAVPGVTMTGPANIHFITDIGLAFVASGAGMIYGTRRGAGAFALAGATWPALHALFHIWGWVHHGFPAQTNAAISEAAGVVGVSVVGLWLGLRRARQEGVV